MAITALTVIHKVIRQELFAVSVRLARASAADLPDIQAAIGGVAELLRTHAAYEDVRLDPLLRLVDASLAARMREDHAQQERQLEEICAIATLLAETPDEDFAETLEQLHLDWNHFTGGYLLHLDDEERTMLPVVGTHALPIAVLAEWLAAMDRDEGRVMRQRLCEAASPLERAALEAALGAFVSDERERLSAKTP